MNCVLTKAITSYVPIFIFKKTCTISIPKYNLVNL